MLGEPGATSTLGVVHDVAAGTVALAGLDSQRQSLTVKSLPLSPCNREELGLFWGRGVPQEAVDPELDVLEQAIGRLCPNDRSTVALIAVPGVYPDTGFAEGERPPFAVIEPRSPLLKVFYALATSSRAAFVSTVLNTSDPDSRIAVRRVPQAELPEGPMPQSPLFLKHDLLMACTTLLTDAPASSCRAAAFAALIAAWPSAYSYWSSFGRMFSSADIIAVLRRGQSRTYLGADSECVTVRWNPRRNAEILAMDVALEHALAVQKHVHLPEADALKLALVSLARTLGITVACASRRADSLKATYREVWPPREPFVWAMDLVRQQS
jgi:hypothetical protein